MPNNYGDVALNLSPDWTRAAQRNQKFTIWTIGHEDGKADVYLKDNPDQRHQFAWVSPRYKDEITMLKVKGYQFVHKSTWDKNPDLWGDWTPDGFILCVDQNLMARSEELYLKDKAVREYEMISARDRDSEAAKQLAKRAGIKIIEDDEDDEEEMPARRRRRAS